MITELFIAHPVKAKKDKKAKMIQNICEIDSDEIENDKEACDFMEKDQHEKNYKQEWYKKNSQNIKEKYDSEARKKKYQLRKKVEAKLTKRICEKGKELSEDEEVDQFLTRDTTEKLKKKKWYKENAERIKKRRKEIYDPKQRMERHEKDKVKKKRNAEISDNWVFKKGQVIKGDQHGLNYDHKTRYENKDSKQQTKRRFNNGYNLIFPPSIQSINGLRFSKKSECDENSHAKLSALESEIEEVFNFFENETNEVTEVAKEFVENDDILPRDINDLYDDHKLRQCNKWHALQLKIDAEFQEIAQSVQKSFSCKKDWNYCKISCGRCHEDQLCLDHKRGDDKRSVKTLEVTLNRNDHLKRNASLRLKIGLAKVKNLKLTQEQSLEIKDMENKIGEKHEMFVTQIQHIFERDDPEIEKHGMFKLDRIPIRKELCDNWHHLQEEIESNFDIIAKYFEESLVWPAFLENRNCNVFCQICEHLYKCQENHECLEL